ncbi:50S ribosomal protein L31 [Streptomyces tirandamycinicus]|uniref:50S ribosomal protein L31 n=1 Tax=Streptomyces tirandamycinicus TaxID=2174846 RepID=UPI0022703712|nr:50S ribosomal protein L31 [Streptomyces tirandamycinicus]
MRPLIKLRSTAGTGCTYRVGDAKISNVSHPSTGTGRALDTAGRVERFERRHGRRGALCAARRRTARARSPVTGARARAALRDRRP